MAVLNLEAKQDHLEKVANTRDPIKAIAEFVWSTLDADATDVGVEFRSNPLGGIQEIVINDNGLGNSRERAQSDFSSLGEPSQPQSAGED